MTHSIYYLPGHGGRLNARLGEALLSRGYEITGRETVGDFRRIPFTDQVAIIADDLTANHWQEDGLVIANSFGAYLFLNSQALLQPYIGKVLLLSPIVGEFSNEETRMGFIPPQSGRLFELADCGKFPTPKQCEIHVGENDWQSNPSSVLNLAGKLGIAVTVVPNGGHNLGKSYVSAVLDRWLVARQIFPVA